MEQLPPSTPWRPRSSEGSIRRPRRWAHPPRRRRPSSTFSTCPVRSHEPLVAAEVELPANFDFGKVRNWTRKVPSRHIQTIVERRTSEPELTLSVCRAPAAFSAIAPEAFETRTGTRMGTGNPGKTHRLRYPAGLPIRRWGAPSTRKSPASLLSARTLTHAACGSRRHWVNAPEVPMPTGALILRRYCRPSTTDTHQVCPLTEPKRRRRPTWPLRTRRPWIVVSTVLRLVLETARDGGSCGTLANTSSPIAATRLRPCQASRKAAR